MNNTVYFSIPFQINSFLRSIYFVPTCGGAFADVPVAADDRERLDQLLPAVVLHPLLYRLVLLSLPAHQGEPQHEQRDDGGDSHLRRRLKSTAEGG